MRRLIGVFLSLFLLTGCSGWLEWVPLPDRGSEVPQRIISPAVKIDEIYYRGVLPYRTSAFSGLSRVPSLNRTHLEKSMMETALLYFSPAHYLYEEGQLIGADTGQRWIAEINEGLGHQVLLGLHEADFLTEQGELGGMVLGLVWTRQYTDQSSGETVRLDEEQLLPLIRSGASELVMRLRQTVGVPVVLVNMVMDPGVNYVPAPIRLQGMARAGESQISDWEEVNESFLLLPSQSSRLSAEMSQVNLSFIRLKQSVEEFFPRYINLSGTGRFLKGHLSELTIEMLTELDSRAQTVQLMQYLIAKLPEHFPNDTHINLYLSSSSRPEAIYVRQSDGTEWLHVYRN